MTTFAHFINVGQGNMTLLQLADGKNVLYDCNVTDENRNSVLNYLNKKIGTRKQIDIFICSHREADHMRGLAQVHKKFPIKIIWDTGVPGETTRSSEYVQYMELKRRIGSYEVEIDTYHDFGRTRINILNAKNDQLPDNPNSQSIVLKVSNHRPSDGMYTGSLMLTGDTDAVTWKNIKKRYKSNSLDTDILLASHHGSISFFDDPSDKDNYYISHIKSIDPHMTIISVGPNPHNHPNPIAIQLYEEYTNGSKESNKILRTDKHGNIRLELKDDSHWRLSKNQ